MNIKKFLVFGLIAAVIGTAFANTETDQASATTKKYVTDELSELQTTIPAQSGARAVIYTTTPGTIAPREVKTNLGSSTGDNAMPTVGAVNTVLATKQNTISAVDTNTVLTYTDTAGTVGEKGIYQDTGTYAEQQNNLIDAGTFNAALQNALNMEFVCAGYVDDDPTKPCWLWQIHNESETKSPNLFDIDSIKERSASTQTIIHNNDGSLFVQTNRDSDYAIHTYQKLSALAPKLEVGKTYVLSIDTTGCQKFIYLSGVNQPWMNKGSIKITQEMLDSNVLLYACGLHSKATIYHIQIEEGTTPTPFQPYGENIYIPQNQ